MKRDFASLTIGSASAAVVLCDCKLSRRGHRLLGGVYRAELAVTSFARADPPNSAGDQLLMQTDSESLLHAGIDLAEATWGETKGDLGWTNEDVQRVFTHQVGRAHRKLLLERLGLSPEIDFPTVEYLGNTGAAALPTALSLGIEQRHVRREIESHC